LQWQKNSRDLDPSFVKGMGDFELAFQVKI